MSDIENLTERAIALKDLLASQQTLLLSTVSSKGVPDLSYAPFVKDQAGCFYILVSELAEHTANLLAQPQASVMFIRPETESRNLFARERVIFNCIATEVQSTDPLYRFQLNALETKFGEVVGLLRSLADFHLFALSPQSGRYIVGFGQAFTCDVKNGTVIPYLHH